jgi:hypothetical protein
LNILNGTAAHLPGPFLILEDDVNVTSRIVDVLSHKYMYSRIPKNWEMLFLDHLDLKCHQETTNTRFVGKKQHQQQQFNSANTNKEICHVKFTYQTDAYVIRNKEVARKLVEAGNTDYIQVADWYTNKLFESKAINAYAFMDRVVTQMRSKFGTDIQKNGVDNLIGK